MSKNKYIDELANFNPRTKAIKKAVRGILNWRKAMEEKTKSETKEGRPREVVIIKESEVELIQGQSAAAAQAKALDSKTTLEKKS